MINLPSGVGSSTSARENKFEVSMMWSEQRNQGENFLVIFQIE